MENPEDWGTDRWSEVYKQYLTLSISDLERFISALKIYGAWNLYEAIILSATKKIKGDPIGYVLAVAHSNWVEERRVNEEHIKKAMRIQQAKERTNEQNEKLSNKIEKAKRRLNDSSK